MERIVDSQFGGLMKKLYRLLLSFLFLIPPSCNYNYHQGMKLEEEGRFEEANIEYHRAYTRSPNDKDFQEAHRRTSFATSDDLMKRYRKYLQEKKYDLAFRRLEQARVLTPREPDINGEMAKWYRILIAGRIDFKFQTLRNQVALSDKIALQVRINTFNPKRRLKADIDNQTHLFSVEDVLYDPPQNILMFYTLGAIGVNLANSGRFAGNAQGTSALAKSGSAKFFNRFQKFIDFRTPALVKIQGRLFIADNSPLQPVEQFYPIGSLRESNKEEYRYPSREIRYSLILGNDTIQVENSEEYIGFLPQILYMNRQNRRFFLDFGHLELYQAKVNGLWKFRRIIPEDREYLKDLKKRLLLNPYFYFREGGYLYRHRQSTDS